jgi:hypothetical protein
MPNRTGASDAVLQVHPSGEQPLDDVVVQAMRSRAWAAAPLNAIAPCPAKSLKPEHNLSGINDRTPSGTRMRCGRPRDPTAATGCASHSSAP